MVLGIVIIVVLSACVTYLCAEEINNSFKMRLWLSVFGYAFALIAFFVFSSFYLPDDNLGHSLSCGGAIGLIWSITSQFKK